MSASQQAWEVLREAVRYAERLAGDIDGEHAGGYEDALQVLRDLADDKERLASESGDQEQDR